MPKTAHINLKYRYKFKLFRIDFVTLIVMLFIDRLVIGGASAKVSVMNYGQQVLGDYFITLEPRSEQDLMAAINNLAYNQNNAGRNLNDALVQITENINANSQPERPVSIVILSTGPAADETGTLDGGAAIEKAEALKARLGPKVDIIMLGVSGTATEDGKRIHISD